MMLKSILKTEDQKGSKLPMIEHYKKKFCPQDFDACFNKKCFSEFLRLYSSCEKIQSRIHEEAYGKLCYFCDLPKPRKIFKINSKMREI